MLRRVAVLIILPVVLAATLIGCGTGADSAKVTVNDSAAKVVDDAPGLKELDEADRKLAEKQKVCPVSGSPLGMADMGKPYKMIVKGRVVFLCCDGCKDKVDKDPDGTLKKLDALLAKK